MLFLLLSVECIDPANGIFGVEMLLRVLSLLEMLLVLLLLLRCVELYESSTLDLESSGETKFCLICCCCCWKSCGL